MERIEKKSSKLVTIKDVAAAAGVSLATASRVLNKQGFSSQTSQQRVKQAALDLNYKPNNLARMLKMHHTDTIGLVITDILNPFYAFLADGVFKSVRQMGYHVIVCATDEDEELEKEYINVLLEQRAAGIIAVPTGKNSSHWRQAIDMGVKVVFVDRSVPGITDIDTILVDNVQGAYDAVRYLISLGHTRIGLINGPITTTTGNGRLNGYLNALTEAGITPDPELQENLGFKIEDGLDAARRLLALPNPPTAIFATNNIIAEATIFVLREKKLRIPTDISLIVFDDVPWTTLNIPPITVVSQPMGAIGRLGMELIDKVLKLSEKNLEQPRQKIILSPELIIRSSCSSPNQKERKRL